MKWKQTLARVLLWGCLLGLLPAAAGAQENGRPDSGEVGLFEETILSGITRLCVRTSHRTYTFLCEGGEAVCLDGGKADEEIFSTLLEEIRDREYEKTTAFTPQTQPVAVVELQEGTRTYEASFYSEGDRECSEVIVRGNGKLRYLQTESWRIGTMLLTCEGAWSADAN
jgi:hypothetical protein